MTREALALLVGVALLAAPADSAAQACCAGGTAATPGRLAPHEDALVGIGARVAAVHGSFDAAGAFHTAPPGASEVDVEQDVIAALRVLDRGQLSLLVPFVETRRAVPGRRESSGGIGDVVLAARWDLTLAGASTVVPGIAILAGATLPTGRPIDAATKVLATDATGTGAFGASLGVGAEQRFDRVYVGLTALFAYRAAHTVRGIDDRLAPLWSTQLAVAWLPGDAAIGVAVTGSYEGDATIDGTRAPGTARRLVSASVIGATPIAGAFRAQGALFATPPWAQFGENQSASVGISLAGMYAWM